MLIRVRFTLVHFASNEIGFPCESGASIELLGLPYGLRLGTGEAPYCEEGEEGEVPYCDGSGAKAFLGLYAIDRGTRSSIVAGTILCSTGELEDA